MRTIADTALGSAVGFVVLAAMFIAIWVARDSSARISVVGTQADAEAPLLYSARTHRAPVTRTSITPAQARAMRGK
jgi:hypothetical protein